MSNKTIGRATGSWRSVLYATGVGLAALFIAVTWSNAATDQEQLERAIARARGGVLQARILATGIPGAGAVAEVGDFLRGSPLHDNVAFTPFVQPGAVLD